MFYSIPVNSDNIITNTPIGAKSITHIYFENKNDNVFQFKEGKPDMVSIAIDGKQICRDVPILPFCTTTPYGVNRFAWADVALEVNINVDLSEIKISAAVENDYNIVLVCSDEPCDEKQGFDFVETKTLLLRSQLFFGDVYTQVRSQYDKIVGEENERTRRVFDFDKKNWQQIIDAKKGIYDTVSDWINGRRLHYQDNLIRIAEYDTAVENYNDNVALYDEVNELCGSSYNAVVATLETLVNYEGYRVAEWIRGVIGQTIQPSMYSNLLRQALSKQIPNYISNYVVFTVTPGGNTGNRTPRFKLLLKYPSWQRNDGNLFEETDEFFTIYDDTSSTKVDNIISFARNLSNISLPSTIKDTSDTPFELQFNIGFKTNPMLAYAYFNDNPHLVLTLTRPTMPTLSEYGVDETEQYTQDITYEEESDTLIFKMDDGSDNIDESIVADLMDDDATNENSYAYLLANEPIYGTGIYKDVSSDQIIEIPITIAGDNITVNASAANMQAVVHNLINTYSEPAESLWGVENQMTFDREPEWVFVFSTMKPDATSVIVPNDVKLNISLSGADNEIIPQRTDVSVMYANNNIAFRKVKFDFDKNCGMRRSLGVTLDKNTTSESRYPFPISWWRMCLMFGYKKLM